MPATVYTGFGFKFVVPENWTASEERAPSQVTITVQSPGTTFWSLTLLTDQPDPADVLGWTRQLFEQDYADVDAYETPAQSIGRMPALGYDLDFECYDLLSTARLRSFATQEGTVLIIDQGYDAELEGYRPMLDDLTASLTLTHDHEPIEEATGERHEHDCGHDHDHDHDHDRE